MTVAGEGLRSVVLEREFRHGPEKVWRALTESSLIEQWLMKNDFAPEEGRAFTLRVDPVPNWDGVISCRVVGIDPHKSLTYTWGAMGLESVVTFTLTPVANGTLVRMEHAGFPENMQAAYQGARYGWTKFLGNLDGVLDKLGEKKGEGEK